jgi:hypothetical protein
MKVEIDLDFLKKNNLSPTEYVVLYLMDKGIDDFNNDVIMRSLENKGFIENGKITVPLFKNYNCKMWIDKWLELWPTLLTPQNYRISGNRTEVINRMNKFLKEHDYSEEIIFEATKNYLTRKKNENYNFTKRNTKFIKDNDGSTLEQECEALVKGNVKPKDNVRFM